MAFRTIIIEKAKKVNLDLNSIVVNYEDSDYNINLDEIDTIIFDDPMCLISLKLLSKTCEKGINIVLTDASHNPLGTMLPLHNNVRAVKRLTQQIEWEKETKEFLWTKIVEHKIKNQIITLRRVKKKEKISILIKYISELQNNDKTNREGLASRTYFKELFGEEFKRFNDEIINYCLNYVYQIIRSKLSQEIIALGYSTQLGINHKSEYNMFNLADDFIEPYRPIIDYYVYKILFDNKEIYLTPELKRKLTNILNETILLDNKKIKIHTSTKFYIQSLIAFIENGNLELLNFPYLE